jgi:hypothetical protein
MLSGRIHILPGMSVSYDVVPGFGYAEIRSDNFECTHLT